MQSLRLSDLAESSAESIVREGDERLFSVKKKDKTKKSKE